MSLEIKHYLRGKAKQKDVRFINWMYLIEASHI